jgi:hypothetical protein
MCLMQPHTVSKPHDDKTVRAHLQANVQAADSGYWKEHHIALPCGGPRDFTPYGIPEYAEQEFAVHEPLLEFLAELFTVDHARAISQRGLEAGQ